MNGFNPKQLLVLFGVFVSLTLTGCLATGSDIDTDAEVAAPQEQAQPFYHSSYSKLLLPDGLTMDKEESSFVKTDSFTGGNVRFTGKLELDSLGVFFSNTMPKNGWTIVYSSQGKEILQAYTKEAATCIIKITESSFKTTVDIYVADVTPK